MLWRRSATYHFDLDILHRRQVLHVRKHIGLDHCFSSTPGNTYYDDDEDMTTTSPTDTRTTSTSGAYAFGFEPPSSQPSRRSPASPTNTHTNRHPHLSPGPDRYHSPSLHPLPSQHDHSSAHPQPNSHANLNSQMRYESPSAKGFDDNASNSTSLFDRAASQMSIFND